jgi:glycerol-3-phosphate cytidylyltransferase
LDVSKICKGEILMEGKMFKIGYTTGVFDLFHIGHLNIIKRAKEQCEYLIVGVSTDDLVEKYKHKRPIVPFNERIEIVGALRYVDKVVAQTSMDKVDAWKTLHFDALFHGDDWKGSKMYDDLEEIFSKLGVCIVFLPHTEGISSTLLIDKIHRMV